MSPVKIAAALAVCVLLFWLAFRITRVMVDLGIAAGHAEVRRREDEEGR